MQMIKRKALLHSKPVAGETSLAQKIHRPKKHMGIPPPENSSMRMQAFRNACPTRRYSKSQVKLALTEAGVHRSIVTSGMCTWMPCTLRNNMPLHILSPQITCLSPLRPMAPLVA